MGLRHPPMPIHLERIPGWFIDRYKRVHEAPAPRRPRLGLSEAECQQKLRPKRRLLIGARKPQGDWYDRRIDERMAEMKWLTLPRKH